MARRPVIPAALTGGPFTLQEALAAGLSGSALRSSAWRRVARGLYVHSSVPDDPVVILGGVRRLLPEGAVFAGRSAAALQGVRVPYGDPIQVIAPGASGASRGAFVNLSRADLDPGDVLCHCGVPATSLPRAALDICRETPLVEAVALLDEMLHDGFVAPDLLTEAVERWRGKHGIDRLRSAARLADGRSESPMETRLRLLLIRAGLPRPEVQADIHDAQGRFIARVDLFYPDVRLCIEYDGANHRDRLEEDDRRQNRILAANYGLLRYTAADFRGDQRRIAQEVRAARNGVRGPKRRN